MSIRVCEHGQLARSCNICELEAELAALRAPGMVCVPEADLRAITIAFVALMLLAEIEGDDDDTQSLQDEIRAFAAAVIDSNLVNDDETGITAIRRAMIALARHVLRAARES